MLRNKILKVLWEYSRSTYPSGDSKHTNGVLEKDYDKIAEEIYQIFICNSI